MTALLDLFNGHDDLMVQIKNQDLRISPKLARFVSIKALKMPEM